MSAMLALARDHLAPGHGLDEFILETIEDETLRRARSEALRQGAQRPRFRDFDVLEG